MSSDAGFLPGGEIEIRNPEIARGRIRFALFDFDGTLTTRPMEPGASRLELNAAVAPAGEIRVEVQQADGTPLPGFEATSCTPIQGDKLRHAVYWGERSGDEAWPQRSVRLEFSLRDAQLYAFQFTGSAGPTET